MKTPTRELALGVTCGALLFFLVQGFDLLPILLFAGLGGLVYYRIGGGISKKSTGKIVERSSFSFDDIGGQATAKQELSEALDFIKEGHSTARMGIRPLKGILLCGPPGTGKTMLAKAAASYTDASFVSVAGSDFIEMYAGVGAQRVRELFGKAEKLAKQEGKSRAIIFIDEIDVLGARRGSGASHMEYDQTLNQLLVEMDGLGNASKGRVLLIGATNRADMLDPALTRPGRFDRIVRVDLPDREARLQILTIHTQTKPLGPDVSLSKLASETVGFSGAHLESLTNEAAILAWRRGLKTIPVECFVESIDKVMVGERHDRKPNAEELYRVAIHESGHAIAAEMVRQGSVSNVSILSRGGALGYVRHNPEQDRYLETEDYLRGQLMVLLAGGVAERMVLGTLSTGTRGDYSQATEVAMRLIAAGMSSLGVVGEQLVPRSALHTEVQRLIRELELKVEGNLRERQSCLIALAGYLMERESITGEELQELLGGFNSAG